MNEALGYHHQLLSAELVKKREMGFQKYSFYISEQVPF